MQKTSAPVLEKFFFYFSSPKARIVESANTTLRILAANIHFSIVTTNAESWETHAGLLFVVRLSQSHVQISQSQVWSNLIGHKSGYK